MTDKWTDTLVELHREFDSKTRPCKFKWEPFTVRVCYDGYSTPEWRDDATVVPSYKVTIQDDKGHSFSTKAYGSIHDGANNVTDKHEEMAAIVVDELASAYCDPDEFWELAISVLRPSRDRVKMLDEFIAVAQEFGEPLMSVAEMLREREEARS